MNTSTARASAFSGGAGLLSTASDYARFLQMLLNGGELDGARLLSPKTVELMTSNHVGNLMQEGKFGFGLGFEITEHVGRAGRPGSVGEFGWGGAYHTQMWVDPQEQLVVVYMTQTLPCRSARSAAALPRADLLVAARRADEEAAGAGAEGGSRRQRRARRVSRLTISC